MIENEIWKDIPETEGNYQVSNLGRVRSIEKVIIKSNNQTYTRVSKIMKPAIDGRGYYRVALSHNDKLSTYKVHRLVCQAFIPNPENKPQVNHIDGNKLNNTTSNLEWNTHDENISHAIRTGLIKMSYTPEERRKSVNTYIKKGDEVGTSLLTTQQVIEIREKFKPTIYTRRMLAEEYGVAPATIKGIVLRRSWKHI